MVIMVIQLVTKLKQFKFFLASHANVNANLLFLRKARLFVKSRYSRNRQWSKSIVYFGLWFNITSVIWTVYYCYRYIFIFSHLYWLGAVMVGVAALRVSKSISIASIQK